MPKILDYPKASMKKSLELATAVAELGGSATTEMAADKLSKKVSGAFHNVITASAKYGFIEHRRGHLTITPLYKDYKLAYSDEEAKEIFRKSFLSIPLFSRIYERFKNQKLPLDIFTKLLIKEFDVGENHASRVAKYFIEGARSVGLLGSDNSFITKEEVHEEAQQKMDEEKSKSDEELNRVDSVTGKNLISSDAYSVQITGPGMNSVITLVEQDDLVIVEAMLNKVKKKLEEIKNSDN